VVGILRAAVADVGAVGGLTPRCAVDEYLRSSFEPDAEYVAGEIVLRTGVQKPHSKMQGFLVRGLYNVAHSIGFEVWPEQRIQTKAIPRHYRVPDVCMTLGEPEEDIFTQPPFLCIEILSPEDSLVELRTKIEEYLAIGTDYVWVIDPTTY